MELHFANRADPADTQQAIRKIAHEINNQLTALYCLIDLADGAPDADFARKSQMFDALDQVGCQVRALFHLVPPR